MLRTAWLLPAVALLARAAAALGPHEILLLVNTASDDSVAVAAQYAALRRVPEPNVIRLALPGGAAAADGSIAPEDFERLIWIPAWRAARERGVAGHILAWVYSAGFPVSVRTPAPVSIHGLTFARNRAPDPAEVRRATRVSPLFAGPRGPGDGAHVPQTFDAAAEWLGDDMPLPSMSLGYTGERGNSREEVIACLVRGARSDGTAPAGTVYFVRGDDVRSTCRHWQFAGARRELLAAGVDAVITNAMPRGGAEAIGLMMGAAWADPAGIAFRPGAMAEHLTSSAAVFHSADQTKLSAWIAAGATASAGAVAEPFANWRKFPAARFFAHYAAGCALIESLYQSIASPLQIYLVGDPLASPWAPAAEVVLEGLPEGDVSGVLSVAARVRAEPGDHFGRFLFLLDGRGVGREPTLRLDTGGLAGGEHTLRCVAYRTGLARSQAFTERSFRVAARR